MKVFIPHTFTTLNEYTGTNRMNRYAGNSVKQSETDISMIAFKNEQPIKKYPIKIKFTWYLKDKRKDLDNVAFAKKFILDGMVKANVIENDGLNYIQELRDIVVFSKEEGVMVEIKEC